MSTKSGRKRVVGEIEGNKPTLHARKLNLDSRRYLRTDDINNAEQPFYKRNFGIHSKSNASCSTTK